MRMRVMIAVVNVLKKISLYMKIKQIEMMNLNRNFCKIEKKFDIF